MFNWWIIWSRILQRCGFCTGFCMVDKDSCRIDATAKWIMTVNQKYIYTFIYWSKSSGVCLAFWTGTSELWTEGQLLVTVVPAVPPYCFEQLLLLLCNACLGIPAVAHMQILKKKPIPAIPPFAIPVAYRDFSLLSTICILKSFPSVVPWRAVSMNFFVLMFYLEIQWIPKLDCLLMRFWKWY